MGDESPVSLLFIVDGTCRCVRDVCVVWVCCVYFSSKFRLFCFFLEKERQLKLRERDREFNFESTWGGDS